MKKLILIMLSLILLTGCSANYNINFNEDKIEDEIRIFEDSEKVNNANEKAIEETNDLIFDWEDGYDYYKRELYTTESITGYKYNYSFSYDEYDAMSQLRKCYEDFNFSYANDITLKTSNEFECGNYYPNAKELRLNISSKYQITSSNADEKKNNTHTWIINKDNYKNKPIQITISKTEYQAPKEKKKVDVKKIIVTTLFIVLVIVFIRRKKHNK